MKFCSKWVTAQWSCDCKLQFVRRAWKRDTQHYRKCAFTNVAYVDPNMESIFEFNILRFSPDMFCHISVIKDYCSVVAYGCFFLAWTSSSEWRGKPKVSPALSSPLMLRLFLFECVPSLAFHISFSPLTNLSVLMLNFTELMAADDYLNWILPKCTLVIVKCVALITGVHRSAHVVK